MKIGIIGTGRIGGGLARQLAGAGHELKLSFTRSAWWDEFYAGVRDHVAVSTPDP